MPQMIQLVITFAFIMDVNYYFSARKGLVFIAVIYKEVTICKMSSAI